MLDLYWFSSLLLEDIIRSVIKDLTMLYDNIPIIKVQSIIIDIKASSNEGNKAWYCFPFFILCSKAFILSNFIPPFLKLANNPDIKK